MKEEEQLTPEQQWRQQQEQQQEQEDEKKKKKKIALLILLILLCLLITRCSRWLSPISPDYPPQGTEKNQKPIDGDDSDKMDSEEGGGAINVTYSMDVTVDLSEQTVSLYYANPNASNQNVAILVMIDDLVVAKSDLITPGNQVTELPLEAYARGKLREGGYDARLVVRSYHPESGEKAMIDTEGKISLIVEK